MISAFDQMEQQEQEQKEGNTKTKSKKKETVATPVQIIETKELPNTIPVDFNDMKTTSKNLHLTGVVDRGINKAVTYFSKKPGLHKVDRSIVANTMMHALDNLSENELDALENAVKQQLMYKVLR